MDSTQGGRAAQTYGPTEMIIRGLPSWLARGGSRILEKGGGGPVDRVARGGPYYDPARGVWGMPPGKF